MLEVGRELGPGPPRALLAALITVFEPCFGDVPVPGQPFPRVQGLSRNLVDAGRRDGAVARVFGHFSVDFVQIGEGHPPVGTTRGNQDGQTFTVPSMSQDTATPLPVTEAPAAPAEPAKNTGERKPDTIGERRAAFLAKVNSAIAAGAEPEPAAPVETPATETPAPETPKVEGSPTDPPKPAEGETQKQYAHRVAAAQLATQRAEAKALAEGERAKQSEAKVVELQAKLDAAAKDPKVALALAGMDPVSFAEAMRDGKITAAQVQEAKLELPPEVLELIEQGKAAKKKAEADAKAAEAAEVRSENLKKVSDVVNTPDFQADFPALAGSFNAAERLLNYITIGMDETGAEPDFRAVAKIFNDAIVKEAHQILLHKPALKVLLGNAEVKAAILAELQPEKVATEQTAPATAPAKQSEKGSPATTITNKVASKIPSRASRGTSSADLAARINSTILGR